jgi:hypothetical protein
MKNILPIFCNFILLFLTACKKEKNTNPGSYDEIKIEHIAALETSMSNHLIEAINTNGTVLLKPGDVIVYKTNIGRFGKMKIVSINSADNYKLTINAETYKADGSIYQGKSNVEIQGTFIAELDEIVEASNNSLGDFFWNRADTHLTNLVPEQGAKFIKYNF